MLSADTFYSATVEESIGCESPLTTSVAFGGSSLNRLYVTSGCDGLSAADKSRFKDAGRLFQITSSDPSFGAAAPQPSFDPSM